MKHKAVIICLLAWALVICGLFGGCASSVIAEDRYAQPLPVLDPEDGVAKDADVVLYYRLTGEAYLVPVARSIAVRANERTETAIIRTLLEGVPQQSLSGNVSALFPEGTSIEEVSLDSGILYVTLSSEFLDESSVEAVRKATGVFGANSQAAQQAQAAVLRAEEEMYLTRRLGIYSLVNTLTGYSQEDVRVQILVDVEGNGEGVRLPVSALGMQSPQGASSDLLEPLAFLEEVIATPEHIAECLLARLVSGEFEMAYVLFLEAAGEQQKPSYANFETEILSLGSLLDYELFSWEENRDGSVTVTVNMTFRRADGQTANIENAQLILKKEGDIYKADYNSFKRILEAA